VGRELFAQPPCVSAGLQPLELHAEPRHHFRDLLKMPQLLARQTGQRQALALALRIGKDQRQRRGCGFLFAVGVITQQILPARAGGI